MEEMGKKAEGLLRIAPTYYIFTSLLQWFWPDDLSLSSLCALLQYTAVKYYPAMCDSNSDRKEWTKECVGQRKDVPGKVYGARLVIVLGFVESLIIVTRQPGLVLAEQKENEKRRVLMRSLYICLLQSAFDWCSHIQSTPILPC